MKELLKKSSFIGFLFLLDLVAKLFFKDANTLFFGNVGLVATTNQGAAFGFLAGYNWLFVILSIVFLLILFYFFAKIRDLRFGLSFVIAGALGNLLDRLVYGHVIDFIHLGFWPTFNLADVFIVVGVILLLIKTWKKG